MKHRIYADHAATTPLMPEALEAMLPFMKGDFGNPSSNHSWARNPREAVREARAAIAGMAAALKANCARMVRVAKRLDGLVERLRTELVAAFPDAVFPGMGAPRRLPGFVSVALPERSGEGLVHVLDLKGIAVSAGAACDSRNTRVSHVLKAIRLPSRLAKGVIRISLGRETTVGDVDRIASAFI